MTIAIDKHYYTLGNSNLRVSPICLGTMNMSINNTQVPWFKDQKTSYSVLDTYIKSNGNFIDTANFYTNGESEQVIGKYLKENGIRDDMVVATKFTGKLKDNINYLGNGRKSMYKSLERSLESLQTDYIDLLYLHFWDTISTPEEVMKSLDMLIQSGKVNHIGLSDCPAWFVSRCQSLAMEHGYDRIACIQMEYNLVERNLELEYADMCKYYGISIVPWSPLAGGFLTGKQSKESLQGRMKTGTYDHFLKNKNCWDILEKLKHVSKEVGREPVQCAINWCLKRPAVSSVIIGASSSDQLEQTMKSLEFEIPDASLDQLNEISKPDRYNPYGFYETGGFIDKMQHGGKMVVEKEPKWFRTSTH
eukprot:NODE_525_length_6489_cov_0.356338.p2 type:complete len:362 gc:universal NODE_525_length_6489_cov_0.356338:3240-2155(-)